MRWIASLFAEAVRRESSAGNRHLGAMFLLAQAHDAVLSLLQFANNTRVASLVHLRPSRVLGQVAGAPRTQRSCHVCGAPGSAVLDVAVAGRNSDTAPTAEVVRALATLQRGGGNH